MLNLKGPTTNNPTWGQRKEQFGLWIPIATPPMILRGCGANIRVVLQKDFGTYTVRHVCHMNLVDLGKWCTVHLGQDYKMKKVILDLSMVLEVK